MPGLPLAVGEDANPGRHCFHSGTVDTMCRQESRVHLSAEEAIAAEQSLSVYCKPVELYNILQRRAFRNPSFLQRCLHYKIEAKRKKRVQMSISLCEALNTGVQAQNILPLYVLLVNPASDVAAGGHSAVYHVSRASIVAASSGVERKDQREANFLLPEIDKLLAETKSDTILLVSCADRKKSLCEGNLIKERNDTASFPSNVGGYCLWGEIPMDSLQLSTKYANLSSVHGVEILTTVTMQSCFLEPTYLCKGSFISPKVPDSPFNMQVHVRIFLQEVGAKESSPYNSYTYANLPPPSLSYIMRLRFGNVLFNYKYYNNTLQQTEVTENFTCPFCMVHCASFKGLRYHLCATHDLFNYEFWVTEEYQAVNISVKSDIWISEVGDGFDPRLETFSRCWKPLKRRRSKIVLGNAKNVHPHVLRSESLEVAGEGFREGVLEKEDVGSSIPRPNIRCPVDSPPSDQISLRKYENGVHFSKQTDETSKTSLCEIELLRHKNMESNGLEDPSFAEGMEDVASSPNIVANCTARVESALGLDCVQQESGSNLIPPAMLPFGKTRKLSIDRSDPRNRILLQKRQFFHSHRAQPMAMEQVLSDRDSEDEVDDDIADFEDRRMLDDFVDVTRDEKRIMHLWNSFVRKQRVLADGHIPWACEAFSRLHADELVQYPRLMWCWRLFMIKMWTHSLLDAHTMDSCSIIVQSKECENFKPK